MDELSNINPECQARGVWLRGRRPKRLLQQLAIEPMRCPFRPL